MFLTGYSPPSKTQESSVNVAKRLFKIYKYVCLDIAGLQVATTDLDTQVILLEGNVGQMNLTITSLESIAEAHDIRLDQSEEDIQGQVDQPTICMTEFFQHFG